MRTRWVAVALVILAVIVGGGGYRRAQAPRRTLTIGMRSRRRICRTSASTSRRSSVTSKKRNQP